MAVGVIISDKPLSGSCGNINTKGVCMVCGDDKNLCENS